MNPEIGVLDFSIQRPRQSGLDAIQSTGQIACEAEKLGFARSGLQNTTRKIHVIVHRRSWLGMLASQTNRIRLGAGGVLLRYRDPYLVAQAFNLLSALHPERIDLGIARGRIGGEVRQYFEASNTTDQALENKCMLLSQLFRNKSSSRVLRPVTTPPQMWMLGGKGAALAAIRDKCSLCLDRFYQQLPDTAIRDILMKVQ